MTLLLQIASVAMLGGLTGVAELVSRYRDEPIRVLTHLAGLAYVGINAAAATLALLLVHVYGWHFGLGPDASTASVAVLQVLVAGTAAAALFRSSLFTVQVGDQAVGVGPSAILDVLLGSVDRSVDRLRGVERLALVRRLPASLSFERDAVALTSYALAALQNLAASDAERLGHQANALKLNPDLDDHAKLRLFALDLLRVVGERGLRAAIAQLTLARSAEHVESLHDDSQSVELPPPWFPPNPFASDSDREPEPGRPTDDSDGSQDVHLPVEAEPEPEAAFATRAPTNEYLERAKRNERLRQVISQGEELTGSKEWALPEVWLELARARALLLPTGTRWDSTEVSPVIKALENALDLRPAFPDAYLEIGRVRTSEDAYTTTRAIEALELGLSVSDGPEIHAALLFQRAVIARREAQAEQAAELLTRAVANGRVDPDAVLAAGAAAAAIGRFDQAIANLEGGRPVDDGDRAKNLILAGLVHSAAGLDEKAATDLAAAAHLADSSWLDWDGRYTTRDELLRDLGQGLAHFDRHEYTAAIALTGRSLARFLPGCAFLFSSEGGFWSLLPSTQEPPEDQTEEAVNIDRIAKLVLDSLLVTRLGQAVPRGPLAPQQAVKTSATGPTADPITA